MWVLLFDVIESSKVRDREQLLFRLQTAMQEQNERHHRALFAPLEITRGDEVAAVAENGEAVYRLARDFLLALSPYLARVAIAFGEITAGVGTRRAALMDGPAFYAADELMRQMKRSRRLAAIRTGRDWSDTVLNGLLNAVLWDWLDLTPFQRKVTRLYLEGKTQPDIARTVGRTQQQVSRALRAARWEVIRLSEIAIVDVMHRLCESPVEVGAA